MGKGNGRGGGGGGRGGGQRGGHGGSHHGGGHQQAGMFCNHCNTNTHDTNKCFKIKNKNNNSNTGNNNYNQQGSNQQNNKQHKFTICYQCNKKGHHGDNCNQNPNKNNSQNQKNSNITRPCSICEGWHLDKDCNARSRLDKQGRPIVCKWCHNPHYNVQCPMKLDTNWKATNALGISADGKSTTFTGVNGEPLTMSGYVLRPCLYCNGNHLPSNCAHRDVLEPRYEAQAPPIATQVPWQCGMEGQRYHSYQATGNATLTGSHCNPSTGNFYIPQDPKWHDDAPICNPSQWRHDQLQVHYNIPISNSTAYNPHRYNLHPTTDTQQPMGRGNREFHRIIATDRDNDILMSDIDDCDDCDFDDSQHMNNIVKQLSEEGWAIRRRASELRRGGILDENYIPLFGCRPNWV